MENLLSAPIAANASNRHPYDLRAAEDTCLPGEPVLLVPTLEWVELPMDLAGTLRVPIFIRAAGVLLGAGFVDPGFRGQLTLCLTNMGQEEIVVKKNDRVVQMILHEVRNGDRMLFRALPGQYR